MNIKEIALNEIKKTVIQFAGLSPEDAQNLQAHAGNVAKKLSQVPPDDFENETKYAANAIALDANLISANHGNFLDHPNLVAIA